MQALSQLDDNLSEPIFSASLPYAAELIFSLPANWFGLSGILLVGPQWSGLLLDTRPSFNFPLLIVAILCTVPLLYAWASFLLTENISIFNTFFIGRNHLRFFPVLSVIICYALIGDRVIFSQAVYPLCLWMPSCCLAVAIKGYTKRTRPCCKVNFSKYIERKHCSVLPRTLSRLSEKGSLPSGDAAGATAFGLTFILAGHPTVGVALIVMTCLGRVFFVVHHVLDTLAGSLLTVCMHYILKGLGISMTDLSWYHPILLVATAILCFTFQQRYSKRRTDGK